MLLSVMTNVAEVNVPLICSTLQFLELSKDSKVVPSTVVAPVSATVTRTTGLPVATTEFRFIGR